MAALVMIGVATFFLFAEHRVHIFQSLPFFLILLCPLMHFFMHRGHNHDAGGEHEMTAPHAMKKRQAVEKEAYQRGLEEGRNQSHRD
tara:strand:+ start:49574 stop:49834 length:261 start_codon:yes stop_codon:yes gene_type:complete